MKWPWVRREAWEEQFDARVRETNRANEGWKLYDETSRAQRPVRYSVERNGSYISAPSLWGLLAIMFGDWFTHLPARRRASR